MWFKNASIVGLSKKAKFLFPLPELELFAEPSSIGLIGTGWAPVRHDEMHISQGGHILLNFKVQKKVVPASAVKARLAARCIEIEKEQGFAPGKKAKKELKERVIDEMLPTAFSTFATTRVWIDTNAHRVVIDSTSWPVVDMIQRALVASFDEIGLEDVKWPGAKVVTEWLVEEPADYTLDDAVTLQYPGERGKLVKYLRADLSSDDVQSHVQKHGAGVEALAMTFDSRISFVMTPNAQLRSIKPLDITAERAEDKDVFENDFYLMTAELGRLINNLGELA